MHDFFILFAQSAVVALEAAWLTMAVFDNIRHPRLNEREFSRVLGMELVKQDPEVYREVSGRRIENPRLETLLFRTLVAAEATVSAMLWLAALGLLLASIGLVGREFLRRPCHRGGPGFHRHLGQLSDRRRMVLVPDRDATGANDPLLPDPMGHRHPDLPRRRAVNESALDPKSACFHHWTRPAPGRPRSRSCPCPAPAPRRRRGRCAGWRAPGRRWPGRA